MVWAALKASVYDTWRSVRDLNRRQLAHQFLQLLLIGCSALMIWKGLMVCSGTESPVVVVLSESMYPTMTRGDILFLWRHDIDHHATAGTAEAATDVATDVVAAAADPPFAVGDIVVFKIAERDTPIVHRIIELHRNTNRTTAATGSGGAQQPPPQWELLTKGDNNPHDDRALYAPGQRWITPADVVGRCSTFLPYVGHVTIRLTETPLLKFALLAVMALFVITAKDGG